MEIKNNIGRRSFLKLSAAASAATGSRYRKKHQMHRRGDLVARRCRGARTESKNKDDGREKRKMQRA